MTLAGIDRAGERVILTGTSVERCWRVAIFSAQGVLGATLDGPTQAGERCASLIPAVAADGNTIALYG